MATTIEQLSQGLYSSVLDLCFILKRMDANDLCAKVTSVSKQFPDWVRLRESVLPSFEATLRGGEQFMPWTECVANAVWYGPWEHVEGATTLAEQLGVTKL